MWLWVELKKSEKKYSDKKNSDNSDKMGLAMGWIEKKYSDKKK